MHIALTKMPYSKRRKYVVKDIPDPEDIIIAPVKDVLDIFWNSKDNGDSSIMRQLKLTKDVLHIIKSITDKAFKDMIKESDYQKHQDKWEQVYEF